jgi:acetylglutamate kinase
MVRKLKVYVSGDRGIEVEEVDADRARQLIEEAKAQGRCIIDRKVGEVIEDLKPGVEEVLIFDIVEGG